MTNEELAVMIGSGGHDDLLSVLWEQMRKYFEMYAGKYFRRFRDKCDNAGVELEDLVQECYFAMIEGIRYFNSRNEDQADLLFLTYCKFPMRNHFAEMLGYRGHKDPLNSEKYSLDDTIPNEDTEKITWLDVLEDPEAEKPFRYFEDRSFYSSARRFIRKALEDGGEHEYRVINYRYFRGMTNKEISGIIGLSPERVRQIENKALTRLRDCYELQQLAEYSPYRHVGLENFKHNGSVEEQIVERKELDSWRNTILEMILQKG